MNISILVLLGVISVVFPDQLWNAVLVSKGVFDNLAWPAVVQYLLASKIVCGTSCDRLDWCRIWCISIQHLNCTMSNIMVSPLYISNPVNVYQCYTKQEKDYVVGSTATSSPIHIYLTRVPSNLVRGIYNYDSLTGCGVPFDYNSFTPWILIKLKSPQTIHEIRITTQPYNYEPDLPSGAVVSVGTTPPTAPGNFATFAIFGTLPNSVTVLTTYSLKSGTDMRNIQYISLQKFASTALAICQVMAL